MVGAMLDITERMRADQELRKLSAALEQSSALVMITSHLGDIEYVNPRFTVVTGYTLDEVRGKNPRFLKSGEKPAEDYRALWETITSGQDWHGEFQNKKKDGTLYWEQASISPMRNAAGVDHALHLGKGRHHGSQGPGSPALPGAEDGINRPAGRRCCP